MTSAVRSRAHRLTTPNGHSKVWFLEVLIGRTAQVPRAVTPMQHSKRNGPRRLVLRPLYICGAGDSAYVQKSGHPANQNFITKVISTSATRGVLIS